MFRPGPKHDRDKSTPRARRAGGEVRMRDSAFLRPFWGEFRCETSVDQLGTPRKHDIGVTLPANSATIAGDGRRTEGRERGALSFDVGGVVDR
jgi:hypothetical protein